MKGYSKKDAQVSFLFFLDNYTNCTNKMFGIFSLFISLAFVIVFDIVLAKTILVIGFICIIEEEINALNLENEE